MTVTIEVDAFFLRTRNYIYIYENIEPVSSIPCYLWKIQENTMEKLYVPSISGMGRSSWRTNLENGLQLITSRKAFGQRLPGDSNFSEKMVSSLGFDWSSTRRFRALALSFFFLDLGERPGSSFCSGSLPHPNLKK